jgi:uncharacterized membrane protein YkoI
MKVMKGSTIALLALFPLLLMADPGEDLESIRELRRTGAILPLEAFLQQARTLRPGRVLEVELEREGGLLIYELEMLDAVGRVWEVKFDARTGTLLQNREED